MQITNISENESFTWQFQRLRSEEQIDERRDSEDEEFDTLTKTIRREDDE